MSEHTARNAPRTGAEPADAAVDRRTFLRRASLGMGAVGAAAVAGITPDAEAQIGASSAAGGGYRETEHVRRYYTTAARF